MRITIIGAGAMGCIYAAMLSTTNEVTLVDSYDKTVEAIKKNGVTVTDKTGAKRNYNIPVFSSNEISSNENKSGNCVPKPAELLIIFVKSTATDAALAGNLPLVGEDTLVLSLQNGMGNGEIIEKYVRRENILLGTTKHNAVTLEPGVVYHSGRGMTNIGAMYKNEEGARRIAEAFRTAGIETQYCDSVKTLIWKKLFVNLTINPITALLDTNIGFLKDNPYARQLAEALLTEAVSVANADGESFDYSATVSDVYAVADADSTGKASMCQDISHGRRTEIDFINGSVCRLGRKYGIQTPVNDTVAVMIHAKEALVCVK